MRNQVSIRDRGPVQFIAALLFAIFLPSFAAAQEVGDPAEDSGPAAATAEPAAQDSKPAKPSAGKIEEVIVTGTRIQRDSDSGLGPISILDSQALTLKGAFSAGDLLRDLPSVGLNGINETQTNGGRGLETIDLRDLGEARTLILVNGRRFVASSTGASEAVDLNNLPPQLIERIDVLRDGVSTIYGADAVAGVINFILRRDFDGLQFDASGGINQRNDGENGAASLLWGKNFSRGNVTLTGSYSDRQPVNITDRDFSRRPIGILEPDGMGKFFLLRDFRARRDGTVFSNDNPALNGTFFKPSGDASFSTGFNRERDGANITDQLFLTGESQRASLNGLFTFDVSDAVQAFSEMTYTRRNSSQQLTELSLTGTGTAKNPQGFSFPVFRPGDPRNNPFLGTDFLNAAFTDPNGAPLPADQESVNITMVRSFGEFGPRITVDRVQTLRFAGGLRGELPSLLGGMRWEIFGNYGRNDDRETFKNDIDFTRLLRSVQPALCDQDPKCKAAGPGDFFGKNSLLRTPGAARYIHFDAHDTLLFQMRQVGTSLEGSIADLPAGPIKAAIGAEFRREEGIAQPDARLVSGDSANLSRQGTRGHQQIREVFFESQLPILKAIKGAEELTFEVSGRYTNYSSFGGRYLSRYGIGWSPVPLVRFRGVYSQAFRAPGISDLFLGKADSFQILRDRCDGFPDNLKGGSAPQNEKLRAACEAALGAGNFTTDKPFVTGGDSEVRANVGGNPNLSEETADTINLGADFTLPWIENLRLSLDWYRIEIQDPIVGQSAQSRVDDCLLRGSSPDCAALQRAPNGQISFIDLPRTNFGRVRNSGFEFGANYGFFLPYAGDVALDFQGNYLTEYETKSKVGVSNSIGLIDGLGGLPRFRGLLTMSIKPANAWIFQASTRYIAGGKDETRKTLGLPVNSVGEMMYLDLATQYSFGSEGKYILTFGVSNAMDKQPPRVIDGVSNTSLPLYDVYGRRFFAAFRTTFY